MSRIIMTGGGSAGHVTPNLALIPRLQAQGYEVHYIGQNSGIERNLIEPTGIAFYGINAGKLRRYFDLQNLTDLARIGHGFIQAIRIIQKTRPSVVFSKGGFVSCPVVWAAWINNVPIVTHESDLTPGLANRLSAPFATHICYSFPETKAYLNANKAVHTGIPIRDKLLLGDKAEGRRICNFKNKKPTMLVMGGSLGAETINWVLRAALPKLLDQFNVCHLCGQGNIDQTLEGVDGYKQFAYVDKELPDLFAMADVMITRAGATTLFELLALRKPNLLIPLSLSASRGDQVLNAESFKKQMFSEVLKEDQMTAELLTEAIVAVYQHRHKFDQAMRNTSIANGDVMNGTDAVLAVITQLKG